MKLHDQVLVDAIDEFFELDEIGVDAEARICALRDVHALLPEGQSDARAIYEAELYHLGVTDADMPSFGGLNAARRAALLAEHPRYASWLRIRRPLAFAEALAAQGAAVGHG